jgi:hypothetical protein
MLRQVRWAVLLLSVGCVLGFVGGCYYFHEANLWDSVSVLVGVPMALLGLALKSQELVPVPVSEPNSATVETLRLKATPTQSQIIQDVTRYQYGMTVHLETALEKLGLADEETGEHPILLGIKEVDVEGHYGLALAFATLDIPYSVWQEKEEQMTKFFGPDVKVTTREISSTKVEVTIVTVS